MDMRLSRAPLRVAGLLVAVQLGACATQPPAPQVLAPVPSGWQAPVPHQGTLTELSQWWARLEDPVLVEMVDAAQRVSPSVAQARSRIGQARAVQVNSRAALAPALDAQVDASRGFNEQLAGNATVGQVGLQTRWEIDLFGANAAAASAADERLEGAQALWHEARVSVAAEVVLQTSSLRTCGMQLNVAQRDALSRGETSRLLALGENAGLTAPATAALARASAAEASARASQQRMRCEVELKTLVALTGWAEPALRARVLTEVQRPATPDAVFALATLPAQVLAQRPDIYNAEREVAATSADVGSAQAQRMPRLALSGSIGAGWVRTGGVTSDLSTWTIGPLALRVPLWDGGRRAAQVDAAQARYDEAVALYRARVRQAVSEVEQALVRLYSTAERNTSARAAAQGYRVSFDATNARWRAGLASLVELEDARRTALASETALLELQHERLAAWVLLYRAAGGGWDRGSPGPSLPPRSGIEAHADVPVTR